MPIYRTDRNQLFAPDGSLISEEVVETDITAAATEYDLHTKARQMLAGNTDALTNLTPARNQLATALANCDAIIADAIPPGVARSAVATALANCDAIIAAPTTNVAQAALRIDELATEIKRLANVLDATVIAAARVDDVAAEVKRVTNITEAALVQLARVLKMNSGLIRLVIGSDLLVENTDT